MTIYIILFKCKRDKKMRCYIPCNTPVLTPFVLNVYDVYIVINHGVDLKAKAPPLNWLCYVSVIEIVADGILCYLAHINSGIM